MAADDSGSDYFLYCDGACRGNPGPASAGGLWLDSQGTTVLEFSRALGRATNNVAEYRSLLIGLQELQAYLKESNKNGGADRTAITIRMDSELVVKQIKGEYRVKNAALRPLYEQIRALLGEFGSWKIAHVRRAQNAKADALANRALDQS